MEFFVQIIYFLFITYSDLLFLKNYLQTVSNNSFKIYIDISSNPPSPLVENPNAPDIDGDTPIYMAADFGGNSDFKFLGPLTDNPNAPNKDGETPSSVTNNAEMKRFLETFNTSKNPLVGSTTMSPNKGKKS